MDLKFCPNCGAAVGPNDDFCQNCGFNLKKYRLENADQDTESAEPAAPETPQPTPAPQPAPTPQPESIAQPTPVAPDQDASAQPTQRHRRWPWIVLVLIILLGAGAYFGGSTYYSRGRQLTALADGMVSNDPAAIAKVAVKDDGSTFASTDLTPLTTLYKAKPSVQKSMHTWILDAHTTGAVTVQQKGRILGLFPRYRVVLTPVKVPLSTNLSDAEITWNGNNLSSTNHGAQREFATYPGQYRVAVTGKLDGDSKHLTKTVTVSPFQTPTVLSFNSKSTKTEDTLKSILAQAEEAKTAAEKAADSNKKDNSSSHSTSDSSDDDDIDMDGLPDDTSARNGNDSTEGLIGNWAQNSDTTFTFNDDGTYSGTANGQTSGGTFKVVYRDGDTLNIQFTKNGGSVVEPFAFVDGHLIETHLKLDWHRAN